MAQGAQAQEDDSLTQEHYTIVVTGSKVNKHNLTPASVSVMSQTALQNMQVSSVANLSGVMPNLFIPEYGSKQTRPISIRGIISKVKGTAVGYYIDGMPRFEISSFDTDMLDIKSIEVFRGPQSTLYGRNTLGGVINVNTNTPFEYQGTKLRLGYGNFGQTNIQASNYTKLNNKNGLNVGGYYEHSNGFFQNEFLGKKADESDNYGAKIGYYFRPRYNWLLRLTSNIDYLNQGGYAYAPYNPETGLMSDVRYNRECGYDRLISNSGFMATYKGAKFDVTSQTTFEYIHDTQGLDQDFTEIDNYFVTTGIDSHILSEEITIKSNTPGRLQWVGGLFGFVQKNQQTQGTDYIQKDYISEADYSIGTQNAAAFGQISYNLIGGLSATLGLRLDYEHSSQNYKRVKTVHSSGEQSTLQDFDSELPSTEWIPKFGIQYKINQNMIFANVARGFKAGGFNPNFQTDDEKTYRPEFSDNYEVGFKLGDNPSHFTGDITFFYIDWTNQHISRTIAGLGNVIYNAGHSKSSGIELTLRYLPIRHLTIEGSYGYTSAKFLDYKKSDKQDYSGNHIPMVPANTLSSSATYTIFPTVRAIDRLSFSANVNGVGKMYWIEDNEISQPFYALLGAKISAAKGPVTLTIWGKNLTNTHYLSYYFVSSGKYAQDGKPLTIGLTADIRF